MAKDDWYDAGEQIKKLVQDAVDGKDFSQLSSMITSVVNDAVDSVQAAMQDNIYQHTNREAADRIRRNMQEKQEKARAAEKEKAVVPVKTKLRVPGEISGNVMKWTGFSVSGMLGFSLVILAASAAALGFSIAVPGSILAVLFAGSLSVGICGRNKAALAKRFRRYREVIGDRTYCLIEELASAIGENYKFVRKDLRKMIGKGFFQTGYLDRKETMLITDSDTYQQYLTAQTEYERREMTNQAAREEEAKKKARMEEEQKESDGRLTPKCREVVEEGRRYIRHIHECNEKIPGEAISAKLDRLELVITRIFREVERRPETADDMKKMMSYYLPTTQKLLDAYCEMDDQPIAGQNIESTKKEIEATLDTLNTAFENFLDSFFEEKAWDISSDITVLQTMLAQEGLTGKDFEQK
ncbi:MAG: 5-bromo-4-chloroindolyl phosphate hydrolysis family protein [Lachnospiraceae bacterium]|nr:5-bromo-4-chloroindolyl phosphate hydrolysis family protein [Lachnospiraceae bacterium]MDD7076671.1 5-bromo-4-chloroindolyl phosphate hydrolysis family protein [Lachnospiraceae bacterium]MDY3730839.1 5-bromo-4-chloroindolyl phosphate hydrolysis family protein [Candidatus Choladocola sp.]